MEQVRNVVWTSTFKINGEDQLLEIEELETPVRRGTSWRTHKIWHNGVVAAGAGYQASMDSALRAVRYLEKQTLADKLSYQTTRVTQLEARVAYYESIRDKLLSQMRGLIKMPHSEILALLESMR